MKTIINSATGGVWLVAMILYFVLFIGIASTANLVGEESVSSYESELSQAFASGGICGDRRYVDPDEALGSRSFVELDDLSLSQKWYLGFNYYDAESNLACEYNYGQIGEEYCTFNGCTWNNGTDDCEGQMNASYYGVETTNLFFPGVYDKIASHDNTGFLEAPSPCNHDNVRYNQTLCTEFTCEWYAEGTQQFIDATENSDSLGDTYDQIKPVFTFRPTDIFDTDSTVLNFVLNFVFIIIPLIILIAALWFTFAPTK